MELLDELQSEKFKLMFKKELFKNFTLSLHQDNIITYTEFIKVMKAINQLP